MKTRRTLTFVALLLACPVAAQACAVCGGADDVKLVTAANTVLWALLALVGFIFLATGGAIYFLWKKSQASAPDSYTQYPPAQDDAD